jgi:uncharacterized membrane protein
MTELDGGRRRLPMIVAVAIVAGLLLGPIDLWAQRTFAYPWANLANSSAVWAVGAFAIGAWVRSRRWLPALAGVILLLVAVEAYYVTATLVQHDSITNLWLPSTLAWLLFAVLAGIVFGTAGGWARDGSRWWRVIGIALPGAVLLAEAAMLFHRRDQGDASYRTDSLRTAVIEAVLAVALVLLVGRTARQRLQGLAISVPLALIGCLGLVATGFSN